MFICEQEVKTFLEQWASSENRTMSNLVETIVTDAVVAKQKGQSNDQTNS